VKLLILVVDDEPDVEMLFRQQFRHDLRPGRFTMEFPQSGETALQRINNAAGVSIILILSDINMPGMTGLELLPKVKAARPDVPVIMITAYGDAETKDRAGPRHFLRSPSISECFAAKSTPGSPEPPDFTPRMSASGSSCSGRSRLVARLNPQGGYLTGVTNLSNRFVSKLLSCKEAANSLPSVANPGRLHVVAVSRVVHVGLDMRQLVVRHRSRGEAVLICDLRNRCGNVSGDLADPC
jgi:CheY-like chemotaxis protein